MKKVRWIGPIGFVIKTNSHKIMGGKSDKIVPLENRYAGDGIILK
jgi:hypothetical protein